MFPPPNLLANLCREISIMRQGEKKQPGETVDQYALRMSSVFTQVLPEAKRTAPPTQSSKRFAWEILKIAVFVNGLCPL